MQYPLLQFGPGGLGGLALRTISGGGTGATSWFISLAGVMEDSYSQIRDKRRLRDGEFRAI